VLQPGASGVGEEQGEVAVTEPFKSLGPPTVVLVQQTSGNSVDVPESLDKFGIFPYLSRNVSPVLQTLQNIGDIGMRK
jgi:hypothetical protein